MSVNYPVVMQAWGQSQHAPEGLLMLADGNGEFARALGLEMDASSFGMGMRAKRFSLYAEDGVARIVNVEAPGEFRVSSAEHMRAEEHTSELQSLMRISYAVFCLKQKTLKIPYTYSLHTNRNAIH